jgi:predicted O-methyltransferase YrrM
MNTGYTDLELRRLETQIGLDALRAEKANLIPPPSIMRELYDPWLDYVTNVSAPDMAVSLETACLLLHLCRTRNPKRILDLGSGFSSYVLRLHAGKVGANVTSIDTDADWLAKTGKYLAEHGLSNGDLRLLDDFIAEPAYDLVFHDIGNGALRNKMASFAADHCAPRGVVVFDDAQHGGHAFHAYETCLGGFDVINVACCTHDDTGRFALAAIRTDNPTPSLTEQFVHAALTPSDIHQHVPRMVQLVDELNAQHVIELGSRSGVSTAGWLYALAGTGGRLTTVDLDPAPNVGGWPHWSHVVGDDTSPEVIGALEPAEIIFIDTSHRYLHTVQELSIYRWLVKPGGVICLHDTELLYAEGEPEPFFPVKKAVTEFCAATGYSFDIDPRCWGFAVIRGF